MRWICPTPAGARTDSVLTSPADFAKFLKADREQWPGVAKSIDFKRES